MSQNKNALKGTDMITFNKELMSTTERTAEVKRYSWENSAAVAVLLY